MKKTITENLKVSCGFCLFYHDFEVQFSPGECRIRAIGNDGWPEVSEHGWCGEAEGNEEYCKLQIIQAAENEEYNKLQKGRVEE